ncbi:MAG: hypothetical protein J7L15_04845 [Clostridiales bacterium]|nr:hypothetical protein [Clostridiales bacterium]
MQNIKRINSEEELACIIFYDNCEIKRFSYFDDFAYIKASEYTKKFTRMSKEEFKDIFPEFFI